MTAPLRTCRMGGCEQDVPTALAQEVLCLEHYIEQAFKRLGTARELCQLGQPVEPRILDWLLADAEFAVQSLALDGSSHSPAHRAKLLELLLGLANLQEYLRHHSVQLKLGD